VQVRLLSNDPETPTTRRLRLALDGLPFNYRAGQSTTLTAGGAPTPYSIASSPGETARHGRLEFLIKVDRSTRFGAVVDHLPAGTAVEITPPVGSFTIANVDPASALLFIAGGTGIAPVRSMILEALDTRRPAKLSLVYSSRTPDEFAYASELRALADEGRLSLTLTLTGDAGDWTHARGRAGAAHIADHLRPSTTAFICGPPAMVAEIPTALLSLGLPRGRIVTENW
jgi:ferredoxin-NADP reductase